MLSSISVALLDLAQTSSLPVSCCENYVISLDLDDDGGRIAQPPHLKSILTFRCLCAQENQLVPYHSCKSVC